MLTLFDRSRIAGPGARDGSLARPGQSRSAGRACIAMVLLAVQLGGCFSYVPVGGEVVPAGAQVTVGINDRGRIGLTEAVGPGVRTIHGQLITSTDSMLVLSMSSVEFFDLNVPARMAEERVEVPREFVADFRERRLSRSRTWLTAGLVAVGLVAATLIGIAGFGGDEPGDRPGNGGNGEGQ